MDQDVYLTSGSLLHLNLGWICISLSIIVDLLNPDKHVSLLGAGNGLGLFFSPSQFFFLKLSFFSTDASFSGTPPSYAYDADRAEEQRRHHDMMPYIDDSPSSSPHLSSKSRGSRDTLSSGSLESTKSVSSFYCL